MLTEKSNNKICDDQCNSKLSPTFEMTVTNTDIEGMEFGPMSEENGSSTSRRNTNGKTCDSEVSQKSKLNPFTYLKINIHSLIKSKL